MQLKGNPIYGTVYPNGTKKSFTGPDGITYTYSYDDNNQLAAVTIPNVGAITVNEYTWTRPKSMTLPGGTTKEFVYDPMMRLKELHAKDPAQNPLLNYYYEHDKMDNIKSKYTEHGNYNYGYDDLYQLTSSNNPESQADETFTYDPVGNRLTSAATTGQWNYNQNNELSGYDNVTYEYDANGNTVKKIAGGVVTSYVYNTEDRLTQVWSGEAGTGDMVASYYYDPFGRRLWKDAGSRTYFNYSDEGLIGEFDGSGVEIKTYGYKPGSEWTTDPLFMKVGNEYYFYQNDHLGTPQEMTTVSGAVVWSAKYPSFGKAEIDPAFTVTNNLRFPGQYFDSESGLHYNWNRFYAPETGHYISVDPNGFDDAMNLYAYVLNSPINFVDQEGLFAIPMPPPPPPPPGLPNKRWEPKPPGWTPWPKPKPPKPKPERVEPEYKPIVQQPDDPNKYKCEPPNKKPFYKLCFAFCASIPKIEVLKRISCFILCTTMAIRGGSHGGS